jgi:hypothetical protein
MTSFSIYLGTVEHAYQRSGVHYTGLILGSNGFFPRSRTLYCYTTAGGQVTETTRPDWSATAVPCSTSTNLH